MVVLRLIGITMNPMFAMIVMVVSSLTVVFNSMSLREKMDSIN